MHRIRPTVLLAAGALLFVLTFQLWISSRNPPGFHHDEATFALNAYTIGHSLRDESGAFLPILVPSYGDYKSAAFSYALAPVFLVFGPSDGAARALAALFGIAAIILVGILAYRRAGPGVAVVAVVLAGLTPWLFQLGRVAYDTSAFPFAIVLVFVTVDAWLRRQPSLARSALVGVALAVATYAYGAGRLLGPLLAVALLVFVHRVPWRSLAAAWASYGLLLVPLLVYRIRHPRGLTARYHQTTFITPGMSFAHIVGHTTANYFSDLDPWRWLTLGDRKPYVDVWGAPQLLAVPVLFAAVGVVEILWRRRSDRFWIFVLLAYFLSAIPAALTVDRHDALRLSAMPACLAVLAIPGLEAVMRLPRQAVVAVLAVALAATVVEWGYFVRVYSLHGHDYRTTVFEVDVPALVARGLAGGRTIYVDHDDPYPLTVARWYAVSHGLPASRVVRLGDGAIPPRGSMVMARVQPCDYVCPTIAEADSFVLARAAGPH